jgi:hypothetical protein
LITTKDSSSTSATIVNDTNQLIADNSTNLNRSSTNSNVSNQTLSTSKSNENFKPLSQGLQKNMLETYNITVRYDCIQGYYFFFFYVQ